MWTRLGKMREYKRNERMTRAEFEAFKLIKFRDLVRHANRHSAYYANIIRQRDIDIEACAPTDFPVLTKSMLMANFDAIATDRSVTRQGIAEFLAHSTDPNDLFLDRYRVIHTSGSSGEVGYFVYSQDDWARGTAQGLRRFTPGPKRTRRGRFRLAFYGAIGGHFAGVTMISPARQFPANLTVDVRLCEVNDPLPQVIAQLNAFQPEMIFGYTAAMVQLAAQQRAGVLRIAPIILTTGGEGMTRNDKEILESAFGCPAVGGYGSSEHLMMGLTAPGRDTMILHDDDVIYEVCDDHCLTTNLFNRTLPLIRYRMSDILWPRAVSSRPPYLEIESLIGRSEQPPQFVNRDGATDFISPHTINEIFVKGVTRFQMQLQGNASFRFVICLDPTLDDAQCDAAVAAVQRRLREILAQKLMDNVRFEVVVAADLPVNPRSRKFQLIVAAPAPAAPAESVEGVA